MKRPGFTLIEITAVLLIAAIAAAAVTLRIQGPLARAEMGELIGLIGRFDHLTRVYARQHDRPLLLIVDLATGELRRMDTEKSEPIGSPLQLPSNWRIARLLVGGSDITYRDVEIRCSRLGLTPSYAILLAKDTGKRKWLLVPGLGGGVTVVGDEDGENDDEENVRKALGLTTAWRDAG